LTFNFIDETVFQIHKNSAPRNSLMGFTDGIPVIQVRHFRIPTDLFMKIW